MTKQPIRVLIVEDCPEDRETFKRFLNQDVLHRYVVFEADTGRQGCEFDRAGATPLRFVGLPAS
jgi:CheY-like chemotaxis protein